MNITTGILSFATSGVKTFVDPEMNNEQGLDDPADNLNDPEVVYDQPGADFDEDVDQEDNKNPDVAEEDEKGDDPDQNEGSNEIDNNMDSTDQNPIEPNGEGGDASSAAKETEKEQTSEKDPIEPNGEGGNASSAEKETEKEQTTDNNNNPAAANNANTTPPPPSQPWGQQPPQRMAKPMNQSAVVDPLNGNEANVSALKAQIKKESVRPQVNYANDAALKKQPQTQPVTETQAKSIPSVQEKAPCPSSSVRLPTPEDDAAALYRAFKGKGCDVGKVVQILAQRDSTHRNEIAKSYKRNYDEELSDRISSEFSRIGLLGDLKEQVGVDLTVNPTGSFSLLCSDIKRAITLWLLNESERDATIVWQSLQVTSLDRAAVTEVICSRTPSQLGSLKQAYFTKYRSRLLEDISASTFRFYGYHKELLIACLDDKTARDEGTNVDPKMVEEDAKKLYKDGEKIWGTNEKTFVEIFTKSNRRHLAAVDGAYEKLYGHSLEEAVKKETSGSFGAGLLTLLRCAKNSAKFFAEVLYNAMNGLGTSNAILLRTVVTKAGSIEMEDIKKEYSVAYKISLLDAIHKDTSGHYRTFLLNLVEQPKGALAVD